ncbi:phage protease [Pseudovibrio exalbescens]|uniref:phage protease n=1 Tax=Pseudovibrio exalbescens TaxID=197461 RepID=UPI0023667076|nr:phage protease [Pseudovibrio exalbescens]MDD7908553.1 phage protease [Pseudovibrio exalbescens]
MNRHAHLALTINEIQLDGNNVVPAWIELVPAGRFEGRDGRWFVNDRPEDVVAFFLEDELDLVVDYEHATEWGNVSGAPAAGWIKELEIRDGALWGRVEWVTRASEMIANKEFRFISPVFWEDLQTHRVLKLVSAALTHQPNLKMTALNSSRLTPPQDFVSPDQHKGTVAMKDEQRKALCKTLGLADEASDSSILEAVATLKNDFSKAQNSLQTPDPKKFVPVADFNLMKERAEKAENASKEVFKAEVEKAINSAVEAGKIAPGSKEFYVKSCNTQDDLDSFNKLVAGGASAAVTKPSGLDQADPSKGKAALSADERLIVKQLGLSEEDYLKQRESASS